MQSEMASASTVTATITKADAKYLLSVEIWETGRTRVLVNKVAQSLLEAEAAAQFFTAQHRIPWYAVKVRYR